MATAKIISRPTVKLYDEDYYDWTRAQAAALRRLAGEHWDGPLDLANLAEEVDDLGRSVKHAVRSQVTRLIIHVLKLAHSPASAPRDLWLDTVDHARAEIEDLMTRSIRAEIEPELPKLYKRAKREVERALKRHGETADLPKACPYKLDDLLQDDWYPAPSES